MATLPQSPVTMPGSLRATAILNLGAGARRQHEIAGTLSAIFAEQGSELRIGFARRPRDIYEFAKQAITDRQDVILAGGGDGTISAVASVMAGTTSCLGILPLGTFNLFARDLDIPSDIESAVRLCFEGSVRTVPLATINERPFLNNASLGLYPTMLRVREEAYHRWGRMRLLAYLTAIPAVMRRSRHMTIEIAAHDRILRFRTPLLFAARNLQQVAQFGLGGTECIHDGNIGFYILPPLSRFGLLRVGVRLLLRRLDVGRDMQFICAREATVFTRREWVNVAYDGEIQRMQSPLVFSVRQDALRVLVPRVEVAA